MDKFTFKNRLDNLSVADEHEALGYKGKTYLTYGDVRREILRIKNILVQGGVQKGDKVILLSENQPNWPVVYLAVTSFGAVIVPILPDFKEAQITIIINHSEATLIFLSEKQKMKMENSAFDIPFYSLEDFSLISGSINNSLSYSRDCQGVLDDDVAAILYTSGTTGNSKGVMLSHKNIISNVDASSDIISISTEDRFLSLLPLAHTYECTLGMLFPIFNGSTVTYLEGSPTPRVLMDALAAVKPTMILSVPLLIEKIYRSKVAGKFKASPFLSFLYGLKPFRILLNKVAGKKLLKAFGGKLRFFGVGGAPMAPDVETFLKDSGFPYSIGYGLTETAPLLAGDHPQNQAYRSTGKPISNGKLRIGDIDEETGVGEIQAFGPNIMKGYFKESQLTSEVFTEDGWLKTGDLGSITGDGRLYIRGRKKNLILGSNGKNIYPEEIESIINEHEMVEESLIAEKGRELVAMIYLNGEKLSNEIKKLKLPMQKIDDYKESLLESVRLEVNKHLNQGIRLSLFVEQDLPFEKTPSLKIKRYLYL